MNECATLTKYSKQVAMFTVGEAVLVSNSCSRLMRVVYKVGVRMSRQYSSMSMLMKGTSAMLQQERGEERGEERRIDASTVVLGLAYLLQ